MFFYCQKHETLLFISLVVLPITIFIPFVHLGVSDIHFEISFSFITLLDHFCFISSSLSLELAYMRVQVHLKISIYLFFNRTIDYNVLFISKVLLFKLKLYWVLIYFNIDKIINSGE